jgi:hypothetical protein
MDDEPLIIGRQEWAEYTKSKKLLPAGEQIELSEEEELAFLKWKAEKEKKKLKIEEIEELKPVKPTKPTKPVAKADVEETIRPKTTATTKPVEPTKPVESVKTVEPTKTVATIKADIVPSLTPQERNKRYSKIKTDLAIILQQKVTINKTDLHGLVPKHEDIHVNLGFLDQQLKVGSERRDDSLIGNYDLLDALINKLLVRKTAASTFGAGKTINDKAKKIVYRYGLEEILFAAELALIDDKDPKISKYLQNNKFTSFLKEYKKNKEINDSKNLSVFLLETDFSEIIRAQNKVDNPKLLTLNDPFITFAEKEATIKNNPVSWLHTKKVGFSSDLTTRKKARDEKLDGAKFFFTALNEKKDRAAARTGFLTNALLNIAAEFPNKTATELMEDNVFLKKMSYLYDEYQRDKKINPKGSKADLGYGFSLSKTSKAKALFDRLVHEKAKLIQLTEVELNVANGSVDGVDRVVNKGFLPRRWWNSLSTKYQEVGVTDDGSGLPKEAVIVNELLANSKPIFWSRAKSKKFCNSTAQDFAAKYTKFEVEQQRLNNVVAKITDVNRFKETITEKQNETASKISIATRKKDSSRVRTI